MLLSPNRENLIYILPNTGVKTLSAPPQWLEAGQIKPILKPIPEPGPTEHNMKHTLSLNP